MGIQISNLISDAAFDWKSVVDQLIELEQVPVTKLQKEKTANTDKITALADINSALEALQDSMQAMRADTPFLERAVTSSDVNTTWKSASASGAPNGSYAFEVQTLASAARLNGGGDIGQSLGDTSADLSGLTMSSLPIATSVKAGMFTVNGKQITFAATDSLKSVLDQITTATGSTVSWSYDNATDAITLTSSTGSLVLGAANDTSNFLQAMKLSNNGTVSTTSSSALAIVAKSSPLVSARLGADITAVDAEGNGSFSINGVAIAYNVNTDSLNTVLDRITKSAAGVTATYDSSADRVILTNQVTGDIGVTVDEGAGGLLAALNLTSTGAAAPTYTSGTNLKYRVDGGDWMTSATNTVDSTSHGITGLSVTVNSIGTQTLTVQSNTEPMQDAVGTFIEKFNAVQDLIDSYTEVEVSGTTTSAAILANNREIQTWARDLRKMAFDQVTNVVGSIQDLDDLGIDFDGITSHLVIKDPAKLSSAFTDNPEQVQSYFSANGNGLVPQMYDLLTRMMTNDTKQQETIRVASLKIDDQISTLETRIASEREKLTNAFIRMQEAQSLAKTQNEALTNAFSNNSDS